MPASDHISIDCPHCKKRLRGKAALAGKRIRCPNPACGQTITVPTHAAPVGPPAARPVWPWVVGGVGCLAVIGLGVGLVVVLVSTVLLSGNTDPKIAQGPPTINPPAITPPPVVPPATNKKTAVSNETKTPPTTDKKSVGGPEVTTPPVTPPPEGEKLIFRLPIDAVATQERLDKLKVIRLDAKARFAIAKNVNDITLMWCWEPNIMVRFEEKFQQANLDNLFKLAQGSGLGEETFVRQIVVKLKEQMKLDAATARRYDAEVEDILRRRDYKALFDAILLIDTNDAHAIFNKRLALRQPPAQAAKMRNLCYALSLSNLVPLKKHAFTIEAGSDVDVRGKPCRQFRVRDTQGTQLELYFDKATDLLAKITTPNGHDPRAVGLVSRTARWDHYFSDYRESDGIKQWRLLECHVDGAPYATLTVERVQYFDRLLPELQLPPPWKGD